MRRIGRILLWTLGVVIGLPLGVLVVALAARGVLGSLDRWEHSRRSDDRVFQNRAPVTYYVSAEGDDDTWGTSTEDAFQTLAAINAIHLGPGDRVLLRGGDRFEGPLRLDASDVGTPARPIVISSYGDGRALIDGGTGDAIEVLNTGGVEVRNLNVIGDGVDTNEGDGVRFDNQLLGATRLTHLRVDRVEASGFGGYGVRVESGSPSRIGMALDWLLPPKSGYRDVRITRVSAHDNGLAGIYVYGEFNPFIAGHYAHRDVYVGSSRAYRNIGRTGRNLAHTGSGIVVSDVDGAVVEHSEAFENGVRSESAVGGPVGIWAWDATRVAIRRNVAYRNRTAGKFDGGGFDLDGGMTHSVMEYNLSYDNDGSGFLLAQFPSAHPFHDNVVRYNVSVGDGRKNATAGLQFWSGDPDSPISRTQVVHNTVLQRPSDTGTPAALRLRASSVDGLAVRHNVFAVVGPGLLVEVGPGQLGVSLDGNVWAADTFLARWDGASVGVDEFLAAVSDPVADVLSPDSLRLAGPLGATSSDAYRPLAGSPLIDAAGSGVVGMDIRGTPVPQGAAADIGAVEYVDGGP